jgi:hypothetical protein
MSHGIAILDIHQHLIDPEKYPTPGQRKSDSYRGGPSGMATTSKLSRERGSVRRFSWRAAWTTRTGTRRRDLFINSPVRPGR